MEKGLQVALLEFFIFIVVAIIGIFVHIEVIGAFQSCEQILDCFHSYFSSNITIPHFVLNIFSLSAILTVLFSIAYIPYSVRKGKEPDRIVIFYVIAMLVIAVLYLIIIYLFGGDITVESKTISRYIDILYV